MGMYEVSVESLRNETSFLFPQISFYKRDGKVIMVDGFYDGVFMEMGITSGCKL